MKNKAREHLERYGIRPSLQRIAVMEYLIKNHTHPAADEIYESLSYDIPTLSKTTVYNTLELLAKHKAILSLDLDPRQTRYDGNNSFHSHFICNSCGAIEDIMNGGAEILRAAEKFSPRGNDIENIQLIYKGYCRDCLKTKNRFD